MLAKFMGRRQPLEERPHGGNDNGILSSRQVGIAPGQQRAEHRNARAERAGEVRQVLVGQVVEFRVEEHVGSVRRPRAQFLVEAVRPVAVGAEYEQRSGSVLLGKGSQHRPRPSAHVYLPRLLRMQPMPRRLRPWECADERANTVKIHLHDS